MIENMNNQTVMYHGLNQLVYLKLVYFMSIIPQ